MFRRIEIIQHIPPEGYEAAVESIHQETGQPKNEIRREFPRDWKMGLLGTADSPAVDTWICCRHRGVSDKASGPLISGFGLRLSTLLRFASGSR